MSSHAPKTDPVTKLIFVLSAVALLAAVYVLLSSLVNTFQRNSTKGELDSTVKVSATAELLKPVGLAATSDAPPPGAAGRSGKEIYGAVCQACHATGILESPKMGDKAAWEARLANGVDALIKTATEGKGSMPARGGDPSITDAELKNSIFYMLSESGLPQSEEAAPAVQAEAPAVAEAPVETAVAPGEAPAAVAAAPAVAVSDEGKAIYESTCFTCHKTGVANAPIVGNKEAWAARIATGMEALYSTSINGKGAMPPKGGNMSLEDAKVKAAVDYMVSQSK